MEPIHKVQKVVKAMKIISRLYFIAGIIGVLASVYCLSAPLLSLPVPFEINHDKIIETLIHSISLVIMHHFADNYYEHELEAGTPFTAAGVRELKRLGMIYIVVSAASLALNYIKMAYFRQAFEMLEYSEIWVGLGFIVFSYFCEYGVELEEKSRDDD